MKLNRKLVLVLSLVLSLALATGGTLAYLSDTDADVNVMTLGSVYIVQNEQERDENGDLVEFTQDQTVYPAVYEGSSIPWAPEAEWVVPGDQAWKVVADNDNVIDKFVTVTNTGKSEAYVRTIFAIEVGPEAQNDPYMHIVTNADNVTEGATWDWDWLVDENGELVMIEIDGSTYHFYVATYTEALPAGETTIPSLKQIYLDKTATNEIVNAYGDTYTIIALSQAVQTNGFADAATALNAAFPYGDSVSATIADWFNGVEVGSPGDKNNTNNPPVKYTGDPKTLQDELVAATDAASGDVTITLTESYDMTGFDWTPVNVDGYHGAGVVTIEGNGNTIKGLNAPLFAGGFAGKSGIVIKDLTIANSDIVSDNGLGVGAFIESADSMHVITLDNCHVVNCTIGTTAAESRIGGLIGWVTGYAKLDDGPVKTYVTVTDCSVVNTEIETFGSLGGIIGHAGASDYTWVTIENCTVTGCELTSTDDGGWRVGVAVGTANNGHVVINNITESGNTLAQTGKTAPEGQSNLYGRFVPSGTGTLEIDGVEIN